MKSISATGLIAGGRESKGERQIIFFTPLNPFGEHFKPPGLSFRCSHEEEPGDDLSVPRKVHYHSNWKHYQDTVYWIKIVTSTRSRIAILSDEVKSYSRTRSRAGKLNLLSNFSQLSSSSPTPHTHTPSPLKPIASIWTSSPWSTSRTTHLISRGLATRIPLQ